MEERKETNTLTLYLPSNNLSPSCREKRVFSILLVETEYKTETPRIPMVIHARKKRNLILPQNTETVCYEDHAMVKVHSNCLPYY